MIGIYFDMTNKCEVFDIIKERNSVEDWLVRYYEFCSGLCADLGPSQSVWLVPGTF